MIVASCVVLAGAPVSKASDRSAADLPPVYLNWRSFTTSDGLADQDIRSLYVADGQVWIGTARGLSRFDGSAFENWSVKNGLDYPVVAIEQDTATRDLWLGTWGGGLLRFSAGRFDTFNQFNSGLAGDLVFSVRVLDGRVWVATNGGVNAYDPVANTWNLYAEHRADTPELLMTSLCAFEDTLTAGAWRAGLWRFDKVADRWSPELAALASPAPVDTNLAEATVVVASGGNAIWSATQTELLRRFPASNWQRRAHHLPPGSAFVQCLVCPNAQEAWLGTDDGIRVLIDFDSATWVDYRRCKGGSGGLVSVSRHGKTVATAQSSTAISGNRVRAIAFSTQGVWVGTSSGLALGTAPQAPVHWKTERDATEAEHEDRCGTGTTRALSGSPDSDVGGPPRAMIAVLGPRTRTIALPGRRAKKVRSRSRADLLAVQLAIEHANKNGGFRNRSPFELTTSASGYDRYGWGTVVDDLPQFGADPRLAGIIGHVDQARRIMRAVILRTEIPVVNVASPDTATLTDSTEHPWIFRCRGDEPRQLRLFLDYLIDHLHRTRLVVLRTPGTETNRYLDWWKGRAAARGHALVGEFTWEAGNQSVTLLLAELRRLEPDVVLTWSDVPTSAAILGELRRAGMGTLFVGGAAIVKDEFMDLVGPDPGHVLAMYPMARRFGTDPSTDFVKRYAERHVRGAKGRPPDALARESYNAADHLLSAVNLAGTDRSTLRQVLDKLSHSAYGEKHFEDAHGPGPAMYAGVEKGRWRFHPLPRR